MTTPQLTRFTAPLLLALLCLNASRVEAASAAELNRSVTVLAQAQVPAPAVQPATLPREAGHGR